MKYIAACLFLITAFLIPLNSVQAKTNILKIKEPKKTICHLPDSANQTIQVAPQALYTHLYHGDTLGPCNSSTPSVPEFGLIPQIVSTVGSIGLLFTLRKKV